MPKLSTPPRAAPQAFADQTPYLQEEHLMIREQTRRFVEREIVPHGEGWEESGKVPREVLRKMGELGLLGIRHPEEYGGSDLDTLATLVFAEELGRSTFGGFSATVLVHTDMSSPHLLRYGNDAQREKYLPAIIRGERIGAIVVTEPGAGSDVANLRTLAVRHGDHYVLNGAKMFVTNGIYGDLYFVAARTDAAATGHRGISMFLVESGTPGVRISKAMKKTGWLCSDTAELAFEDCKVPAENLLGEENQGFRAIMDNFQNERLALSGMVLGEAAKALELTLAHVRQREAFGGTLWDLDSVRQRLAQRSSELAAARQLAYYTAWLDSQGIECVREVSMVKAVCGELDQTVLYDCVQFHGGMGFIRETAVERMWRDARVHSIGGGATEVMLQEVAKRL